MRIDVPVIEVQLKLIQREKSNISSLTLHLFLPRKININKNISYGDLHWEMITSFVHYEGLGIPCTIFKCFNPGTFNTCGNEKSL